MAYSKPNTTTIDLQKANSIVQGALYKPRSTSVLYSFNNKRQ